MSTQRLAVNTKFIWKNNLYRVKNLLPGNHLEIESMVDGSTEIASFVELFTAQTEGTLKFYSPDQEETKPSSAITISLEDYSPKEQAVARYRLEVIKPLINIPEGSRKREHFIQREAEVKAAQGAGRLPQYAISVPSIYLWLAAYAKSGNDIRSLIPQYKKRGRKKSSANNSEVESIIEAVIQEKYFVRERVKIDDIWHEVVLRIAEKNETRAKAHKLPTPSRTTIWRRTEEIDLKDKLLAKRGRRAAKAAMTQYGNMEYPKFPLERVEIDHTLTDIFVVDDEDNLPLGRLTLTYCLDVATRYPLGFYLGFDPPSHLTVSACLHHAIMPKPNVKEQYGTEHEWHACGIPNMLVVDNGKEFISPSLQDACQSLGIVLQQLPVKTPQFKATVERMFGTINTGLFHTLPGTTFSNIGMKGDYESLRFASLRLGDIEKMLHLFLIDVYAETFHRGLGGKPAKQWEAAALNGFFPRIPTNANDLTILLGRVIQRAINSYGIEFQSLRYNCEELSSLRLRLEKEKKEEESKQVKIKYLPNDLSRVYVFDPFEMRYIEVPALDQAYTNGLTLWSHQIIRRYVLDHQDAVSIQALGEAKRKIQEIVNDSKESQAKAKRTRKKIARWEAGNKEDLSSSSLTAELLEWLGHETYDEIPPEDEGWGIEYRDVPQEENIGS